MKPVEKIANVIQDHAGTIEKTFQGQAEKMASFSSKVVNTFEKGGRLLVFGGGSLGAVSNLVANLFLHRLSFARPPLPALSLCNDTVLAMALENDGQSSQFFAKQLRAMATSDDIVLAFSDGCREEPLLEALEVAMQRGCLTAVVMQGKSELGGDPPDFLFRIDTQSIPRAIEGVVFFGNLLCELVEGELFGI